MPKQLQTRAELLTHLREQVEFLRTSATLFDEGRQSEAKRLATAIRILVHDTDNSKSLLGLLGVKTTLSFLDTSLPPNTADQIHMHCGLVTILMAFGGPGASKYRPPLDDLSEPRAGRPRPSFDDWWTAPVLTDNGNNSFARKDLVLGLAHKDGGAHVDPELENAYAALSRGNSLGWHFYDEGGHLLLSESPVLANVRQIAFELESTLLDQLPDLLGSDRSPVAAQPPADGLIVDAFELRRVEEPGSAN